MSWTSFQIRKTAGTFSPQPTSKDTTNQRSRHAPQHVREARAVMHIGIANPRWRGKRSRYSRLVRKPQFHLSGKRLVRCLVTTSSVCISRANTNLITRLLGNSQFNPRVCGYDFNMILEPMLRIKFIFLLRWMPHNSFGDKSNLVQVTAWCRQAPCQFWPKSPTPNGVTRPQWVELFSKYLGKMHDLPTNTFMKIPPESCKQGKYLYMIVVT